MELKDNPFLQQEDYAAGYQENIDKLKNHPELIEMDKLCYEVFVASPTGKALMELLEKRVVLPGHVRPDNKNYANLITFWEGYKECIRSFKYSALSHEQRIKAGTNQ